MAEAHICIDVAIKYNLHKKIIIQYRKNKNKNKYTNKKYEKKMVSFRVLTLGLKFFRIGPARTTLFHTSLHTT